MTWISEAEDKMDHMIKNTIQMNSRWTRSINSMEVIEPKLAQLDTKNPRSAVLAGQILVTLSNLTLSGASAGVDYNGAKDALEIAKTTIVLIDEVAVECLGYAD